jgi:hypothetical protein
MLSERDVRVLEEHGLDPAEVEASIEEYESGDLSRMKFGPAMRGRPKLCQGEELKSVTVKMPASRVAALQRQAREQGVSQSEWIREAIDMRLIAMA